jgi:hypothetical protein
MNKLILRSFINALGTIAYVSAVSTVMSRLEKVFNQNDTVLAPIAFLTLFVLSAAVAGGLVLGKPILMYLDNQKKEAVRLFVCTIGWLALAVAVLMTVSILLK